jgi:hypothetical protein
MLPPFFTPQVELFRLNDPNTSGVLDVKELGDFFRLEGRSPPEVLKQLNAVRSEPPSAAAGKIKWIDWTNFFCDLALQSQEHLDSQLTLLWDIALAAGRLKAGAGKKKEEEEEEKEKEARKSGKRQSLHHALQALDAEAAALAGDEDEETALARGNSGGAGAVPSSSAYPDPSSVQPFTATSPPPHGSGNTVQSSQGPPQSPGRDKRKVTDAVDPPLTDRERVQRLFELIDTDRSGLISTSELDLFFSKCAQAQPFVRSQYLMVSRKRALLLINAVIYGACHC